MVLWLELCACDPDAGLEIEPLWGTSEINQLVFLRVEGRSVAYRPFFACAVDTLKVPAVLFCAMAVCEDVNVVYKASSTSTQPYILIYIEQIGIIEEIEDR